MAEVFCQGVVSFVFQVSTFYKFDTVSKSVSEIR